MKNIQIAAVLLLALLQFNCKDNKKAEAEVAKEAQKVKTDSVLEAKNFDTIIDGKKVALYWIENNGIKAAFTNYGGDS